MADGTNGNCYLCGETLGKTAIKNHLLKAPGNSGGGQKCYLLKIEDAYNKDYWLYMDIPVTASLSSLDAFLRKIWLECCGHYSLFFSPDDSRRSEIGKGRKWNVFPVGANIGYMYDYGSTTDMLITVMGKITREEQKKAVRLLARNVPPAFQCYVCGKPAASICPECIWEDGNQFFCDSCGEKHEHEYLLPVVNSPRMGICSYDGGLDVFGFKPGLTPVEALISPKGSKNIYRKAQFRFEPETLHR